MATIPSKQLHRVGTKSQLEQYLSNREIGYAIDTGFGYIMIDGDLKPLGAVDIPKPTQPSVFIGSSEGNFYWSQDTLSSISNKYVWRTIGGNSIYAEFSERDSEDRFISSSTYKTLSFNPVYGSIRIEDDGSDTYKIVKIRKGNAPEDNSNSYISLGALVPLISNDQDGAILSASSTGLTWIQVSENPEKNSKSPASSGSVYNTKYLIDPTLHTDAPNTKTIPNPGNDYDVNYFYIIDNKLYKCTSKSESSAEFIEIPGVISAINELVRMINER